ncbi:glycoside hydrolase family 125 protein [Clostridium sartagoforme]|uniref:glycoside hydrolase family 125 protein n=1 Tax=Clostridium sartagoforme TaxID=84031 RepID=UPI001FAA721C|nr:glycoside hydrolase family 125 protein [Clostridium sartagoforme]
MEINREFISKAREIIIDKIKDEKVADIFEKCMNNTLDTTVKFHEDETVFIITGDIPAMWLRDSVCQIRPYLLFARDNKDIANMIKGLIRKHYKLIKIDPYANAFNESANGMGHQEDITEMLPEVWERKYELDSLCFTIQLVYLYWKITGDSSHIDNEFLEVINIILDLWELEQNHEENSKYRFNRLNSRARNNLEREGIGTKTKYTGMTWSGFRPSDDACAYGYLVPSNMFAVAVLRYVSEISTEVLKDKDLEKRALKLKEEIEKGIETYGIVHNEKYGDMYAYEVDGFGNSFLVDDANVPSLLSIPLIGYKDNKDVTYINTRNYILSKDNQYYYEGKYAKGIGSPHTPDGYIWHIALAIEALTSDSKEEKLEKIMMMKNTDGDTHFMHESFDPNDPTIFTREWFSWANSMYCELVMDYCGVRLKDIL